MNEEPLGSTAGTTMESIRQFAAGQELANRVSE